jgi:hypothetical protein
MNERGGRRRDPAPAHEESAHPAEGSTRWWANLGAQERAEIERRAGAGERAGGRRALAVREAAHAVDLLLERCAELELDDEDELVLLLAAAHGSLVQLEAEEGLLDD